MHVDLGKGQSAELLDVDDVPRRVKFKVQEWGLTELNRDEKDERRKHPALVQMMMRDMLIARLVTGWTLDLQLPNGDAQHLGDLPSSAYDALFEATEPHFADLDFMREGRAAKNTDARSSDSSPGSKESPSQGSSPATAT